VARSPDIVVVDASVVTKWFVQEPETKQALRLRRDYRDGKVDLWSTQLMPFEVLNALRYNPELGEEELRRAATALAGYRIALYPLLDDLKEGCLRVAVQYGTTIYDAAYVALSEFFGKRLYTTDAKLLAKVKDVSTVRHLAEYGT
jgi:predicted nucleic acid-binding protein